MKRGLIVLAGIFGFLNLTAQNLEPEMLFPDTLRSNSDSFFVNSPKFDKIWSYLISRDDTLRACLEQKFCSHLILDRIIWQFASNIQAAELSTVFS